MTYNVFGGTLNLARSIQIEENKQAFMFRYDSTLTETSSKGRSIAWLIITCAHARQYSTIHSVAPPAMVTGGA